MGETPNARAILYEAVMNEVQEALRPFYISLNFSAARLVEKIIALPELAAAITASAAPGKTPDAWGVLRETIAEAAYNISPFEESGEYVEEHLVSPGGKLSWEYAKKRDAEFAGGYLLPVTADAYALADAVLSLPQIAAMAASAAPGDRPGMLRAANLAREIANAKLRSSRGDLGSMFADQSASDLQAFAERLEREIPAYVGHADPWQTGEPPKDGDDE